MQARVRLGHQHAESKSKLLQRLVFAKTSDISEFPTVGFLSSPPSQQTTALMPFPFTFTHNVPGTANPFLPPPSPHRTRLAPAISPATSATSLGLPHSPVKTGFTFDRDRLSQLASPGLKRSQLPKFPARPSPPSLAPTTVSTTAAGSSGLQQALNAPVSLSRKRGWEPAFGEHRKSPSTSSTTLASASANMNNGYLDGPAKYREMLRNSKNANSSREDFNEMDVPAPDADVSSHHPRYIYLASIIYSCIPPSRLLDTLMASTPTSVHCPPVLSPIDAILPVILLLSVTCLSSFQLSIPNYHLHFRFCLFFSSPDPHMLTDQLVILTLPDPPPLPPPPPPPPIAEPQHEPPAKRRKGIAGSIVDTAVNAALIGTAVGLTVYRLVTTSWRDRHGPSTATANANTNGNGNRNARNRIVSANANANRAGGNKDPPPPPYSPPHHGHQDEQQLSLADATTVVSSASAIKAQLAQKQHQQAGSGLYAHAHAQDETRHQQPNKSSTTATTQGRGKKQVRRRQQVVSRNRPRIIVVRGPAAAAVVGSSGGGGGGSRISQSPAPHVPGQGFVSPPPVYHTSLSASTSSNSNGRLSVQPEFDFSRIGGEERYGGGGVEGEEDVFGSGQAMGESYGYALGGGSVDVDGDGDVSMDMDTDPDGSFTRPLSRLDMHMHVPGGIYDDDATGNTSFGSHLGASDQAEDDWDEGPSHLSSISHTSHHSTGAKSVVEEQMDWIGDKLSVLIEEGKRALGREVVVMSECKEDEVDDGLGGWVDEDDQQQQQQRKGRRRGGSVSANVGMGMGLGLNASAAGPAPGAGFGAVGTRPRSGSVRSTYGYQPQPQPPHGQFLSLPTSTAGAGAGAGRRPRASIPAGFGSTAHNAWPSPTTPAFGPSLTVPPIPTPSWASPPGPSSAAPGSASLPPTPQKPKHTPSSDHLHPQPFYAHPGLAVSQPALSSHGYGYSSSAGHGYGHGSGGSSGGGDGLFAGMGANSTSADDEWQSQELKESMERARMKVLRERGLLR
ncbi:hypothetical protein AX16_009177 [Volvariella volvacea WC 439]|nr:hypothetical protein AX16_009177 [Volvariella volvacea WC 439]